MKRLLVNIAVLTISTVAALCLVEAAMRYEGQRILGDGEFVSAGQIFRKQDPPVGVSLMPGASRIIVSGGDYVSRETINSEGLRDVDHAIEKPPGARRILILGDSFMFGFGVPMDQTMARQLAGMMPAVEVINAGSPGLDLGQEYLLYKDRDWRFGADVVVLGFFINDLDWEPQLEEVEDDHGLPVSYQVKQSELDREKRALSPGHTGFVGQWLRAHSLLYAFVRKRLESLRPAAPTTGGRKEYFTAFSTTEGDISPAWQRGMRILDALEHLVVQHGAKLIVLAVPASFEMSDEAWSSWVSWWKVPPESVSRLEVQEMLGRWCTGPGRDPSTSCLDPLPAFQKATGERLFHAHDLHWTAAGHHIAAIALKDHLLARGLP